MNNDDEILDQSLVESESSGLSRELLPWWMKFFCWVFMILSLFVPGAIVANLLGVEGIELSIYGLQSYRPFSAFGGFILLLFLLKGLVAYGLWNEAEWSINLGIVDAVLGLVICLFVSFVAPFMGDGNEVLISFRLEIIPLVPYFNTLLDLKK